MKHGTWFLVLCLFTSLPGCGGSNDTPDLGKVSGTIKVDGQPKAKLQVTFQPEDGRPSLGQTDDSGHYSLRYTETEEGAVVGKGYMTITTPEPVSDDCGAGDEDGFIDPIPPKYNSQAADNPDMQKEIKSGSNNFDFDVDTSSGEGSPRPDCSGSKPPSCCCG